MNKRPANLHQRGLALIAVLWITAALGLIVTGVVHSLRLEAGTTGRELRQLQALAHGDAAILQVLQNWHGNNRLSSEKLESTPVPWGGQTIDVLTGPLEAYIDLNHASVPLLAEMFRHAAGLDPDNALQLAQALDVYRQTPGPDNRRQGLSTPEDLLQIPGFTYSLYASIAYSVTADLKTGGGLVNPQAAPLGVLQVLAGGDTALASQIAQRRQADPMTMDTSTFNPAFITRGASRFFWLAARVPQPDGGFLVRRWTVFSGTDNRTGLPWKVLARDNPAAARLGF